MTNPTSKRPRTQAQIDSENKREPQYKKMTIRFNKQFHQRVWDTCQIRKLSMAGLIRELLEKWLETNEI